MNLISVFKRFKRKKRALLGRFGRTSRGFGLLEFDDSYGDKCELQISSICADEDTPNGCIWLGIADAEPKILKQDAVKSGLLKPGPHTGWMPYPVPEEVLLHTRMHLNEHQVQGLIERLQLWLKTGELNTPEEEVTCK